ELEVLVDEMERPARARRRVVRAEVAGLVRVGAPHRLELRPLFGGVEAEAEKVLVVAELDVEPRLMLLDELVLEDGRLFLGGGDDGLEVAHDAPQDGDEVPGVAARLLEVALDARAEALGLADVDHRARLVLEEVAAGP